MSKLKSFGPLKTLTYGNQDESAPQIVIFHGFGASAQDLFDLGRVMDPEKKWSWYFPDGCIDVPIGPGFYGKAWFPIDQGALERAMTTGEGVNYSDVRPKGMDEAVNKATRFLSEINFQPESGVVGGFSQGSMMSVEIIKALPMALKGALLFSGALVDRLGLKSSGENFKDMPIYQSHGKHDPVLPIKGAEALRSELGELGAKVQWTSFAGQHEIPMNVLAEAKAFLEKIR